MAIIGTGRGFFGLLTLAVASICTAATRATEAISRFVVALPFMPDAAARIDRWFRELFGLPQLSPLGPSTPASSALLNHNRHEAGLAKLGAVRHI